MMKIVRGGARVECQFGDYPEMAIATAARTPEQSRFLL